MNDVMLDLETMGNGSNAAICAIGATEFDVEAGTLGRKFYYPVDLASSVAAGGVIDASTVIWWLGQSDEARKAITKPGVQIGFALDAFSYWVGECGKGVRVWGNGATFDNVILANAYRRMDKPVPWEFWNDKCYRSLKGLYPDIALQRSGTHHNALDDAVSQAQHAIKLLKRAAEGAPVKKGKRNERKKS